MKVKHLELENLDCANCSAKIERDINAISGVSASINFATKVLTLEVDESNDIQKVLDDTRKIVRKHEPEVILVDKDVRNDNSHIINLEGISCVSCAVKIENSITKLNGISSASIDFTSQRLTLETREKELSSSMKQEITSIIKNTEPEIKIKFNNDTHQSVTKKQVDESSDEEGGEIKQQILKFIVGGAIFAIGVAFNFPETIELLVFLVSYIIVGGDVVLRAIKGITRGQFFSEFFLMSVATIGAFVIKQYPEGVAVMLFYMVGELFQDIAVGHSRKSIAALMDIRPEYAFIKRGNELVKISPEDAVIGDVIVVKPGERIPLDGLVIDGLSMVDTAALTGESMPRELEPGSTALSGFINLNGVLTIKVTKVFAESTVSKILDLVQNASSKKAPTEKFITKFAGYYTPVVVIAALALALIPPLVIPNATFSVWLYRALVFLVISCPCALVISIPLGFFGGIGGASKRGILVKGSNYLEALNNIDMVVFDKTGTLTKGVFSVTELNPQNGFTEDELVEYAAYAESLSNHPIALSIRSAYKDDIDTSLVKNYQEISGHGIRVNIRNKEVLAGNSKLMMNEKIDYIDPDTVGTTIHVSIDNVYAGYIVISDELKSDSVDAIKELKKLGIRKTVMLTGDLKKVGDKIGAQLGLDEVYSELLPEDKVAQLEKLNLQKSKKGKVVFVGDGINDAPVLARADIGIAMGGLGSDAAIEAADIVIMTDEPSKIATSIRVAKKTRNIVLQNIIFALGVKSVFLVLGAFGVATMWEAVFADTGVALIAVVNAMRVMNVKSL